MSQRQTKTINLLKHQSTFLRTKSKFAGLVGGVGSGKTFCGSHYIFGRVNQYPKALHFIGANTFSQLEQVTLKAMFDLLQGFDIDYSYNQNKGLLEFCGGKVLCKSMDNYDAIRGIEIASFWLDEVRDLKKEAFDMMMGRLRDKNALDHQGRVTTTPAGFNWIYDYFHPSGELHNDQFELITASSMDNRYLPEGYVDTLKAMYTEEFFEQEVLGGFVRGGKGTIFPWIIRATKHKLDEILPQDLNKWQIVVALDPASTSTFGVIFIFWNEYTKKIIVFDEIYESSPSLMTAREINNAIDEKLKPWLGKVKRIEYVIDEAAAWFSNEMSEIDSSKWFNRSQKSRFGVDGYINLVRAIMNAGLVEATENCTNFWKEFEGYQRDENGKIPKEKDHLINAFQYLCGYLGIDLKEVLEPKPEQKLERRGYSVGEEISLGNEYAEMD